MRRCTVRRLFGLPDQAPIWRNVAFLLAINLIVASALACAAHAAENDRVALVIGNSNYEQLPSLPNPTNDAKNVAAALWAAGFEAIEVIDANRETMLAAIATFAKRLQEGTDAVFFYAGHGVQSHGANYLLPVDTTVEQASDIAAYGIDANEISLLMANSEARFNILILDACRDNPFAEASSPLLQELAQIDSDLITRAPNLQVMVRSSSGLAPMLATRSETFIGFSTGPGEVALDGSGDNSPYTSALLDYIETPGLEIDTMFRRVRAKVREETEGQQIPWVMSTLENEFYFLPGQAERVASLEEALEQRTEDTRRLGLAPPQRLVEDAFWRIVVTRGEQADFQSYLQRYPDGEYAAQAQGAIAQLAAGARESTVEITTAPQDGDLAIEAFLGTGPVPTNLSGLIEPTRAAVAYEVRTVPTSGTFFRPDGTPVNPGHVVAGQIGELSFLPAIGTRSVGITEYLELAPVGIAGAPAIRIAVVSQIHPCDLLAGFRYAPDRVWDGIEQALLNLDPVPAVEACEQAVTAYPEVDRFAALLTRAYLANGDYPDGLRWAEYTVSRAYPPGYGQLGTIYLRGYGVDPNYAQALELFVQGDELGNPASPLRLGEMYEGGFGVPVDYAEARRWYDRSAELGNAYATTRIAEIYHRGLGVPQDLSAAARLYVEAANAGELTAQVRLARMYRDGVGVEPNLDEALRWARAAAGTGMPEGQKALGQLYTSMPGEQRDLGGAVYWFGLADQNGDPWAPLYLGELYLQEASLGGDPGRAAELFEKAATRGNGSAARALAKLLESDARQSGQAVHWHSVAAEAGNIWSMRDLGRALLGGNGVGRDPGAGFDWLRRAADGGNPWAQRDVGRYYAEGEVVARDTTEAARYLAMASLADDAQVAEAGQSWLERLSEVERVRATQHFLNELGIDVGTPDGIAGPRTRAAIDRVAAALAIAPQPAGSPQLLGSLATALANGTGCPSDQVSVRLRPRLQGPLAPVADDGGPVIGPEMPQPGRAPRPGALDCL